MALIYRQYCFSFNNLTSSGHLIGFQKCSKLFNMILLKANNFKSRFVNISKPNCGTVYIDNLTGHSIGTHTTRLPLLGLLSEDIIFLCSYKSWRLRLNVCFCFLVLAFLKGKQLHFLETYISVD